MYMYNWENIQCNRQLILVKRDKFVCNYSLQFATIRSKCEMIKLVLNF